MPGDPICCLSCAVYYYDIEELKNLLDSNGISDLQAWYLARDLLTKPIKSRLKMLKNYYSGYGWADTESASESKSRSPLYWNGTPLCHVDETNVIDIMKSLLQENHVKDEPRSYDCLELLHMAARLDNTGTAKVLLNHLYPNKKTPQCDVLINNLKTVASLLEMSNDCIWIYDHDMILEIGARLANQQISKLVLNPDSSNEPPLYIAAETNDTDSMKTLLRHNADVEARSNNDLTPLHIAAQQRNTESAEVLLIHGADMNSLCPCALRVLLDAAIWKDNETLVELLLGKGVNINMKTKYGDMLFHSAVKHGNPKVIKLLLNNGADINPPDENNKYKLWQAIKERNFKVIELLIEVYSDPESPMDETQGKILEDLLRDCFEINYEDVEDCSRLLHGAIRGGCLKIVKFILNLGGNFDVESRTINDYEKNATPLHTAISCSQIEIARLLLNKNANVNAKDRCGNTPLHDVLELCEGDCDQYEDMDVVYNHGPQLEFQEAIKLLLEHEANMNDINERWETALHSSARNGNARIIEILLDKGAWINAKRNDGATAIHIAVIRGRTKAVKLLIDRGADIAAEDCYGLTPLHMAAAGNNSEIIDLLLNACDDVDRRDTDGKTALHVAAIYGSHLVVGPLLDHGSDINLTCNTGQTPPDYVNTSVRFQPIYDHIGYDNGYTWPDCLEVRDDPGCSYRECEVKSTFTEHIIKVITVGRYQAGRRFGAESLKELLEEEKLLSPWINKKNLHYIKSGSNEDRFHFYYVKPIRTDNEHFYAQCKAEIECMMEKKIGVSNFSYYDLLTNGMNRLAIYARNKGILIAMETEDHKDMFPLYSAMLDHRFKKGQERAGGLLDSSFQSLRFLTGYSLPDLLFDFLSNEDLRNLIKACDESNI